jgi:hypothetical protein
LKEHSKKTNENGKNGNSSVLCDFGLLPGKMGILLFYVIFGTKKNMTINNLIRANRFLFFSFLTNNFWVAPGKNGNSSVLCDFWNKKKHDLQQTKKN